MVPTEGRTGPRSGPSVPCSPSSVPLSPSERPGDLARARWSEAGGSWLGGAQLWLVARAPLKKRLTRVLERCSPGGAPRVSCTSGFSFFRFSSGDKRAGGECWSEGARGQHPKWYLGAVKGPGLGNWVGEGCLLGSTDWKRDLLWGAGGLQGLWGWALGCPASPEDRTGAMQGYGLPRSGGQGSLWGGDQGLGYSMPRSGGEVLVWVRGYRIPERGTGSTWGRGLAMGHPGLGVQGWRGTPCPGAYRRR